MVGRHHQLNGHEFEQTPGDRERQKSLACCSPWGLKDSDMTERLHFHILEKEMATPSSVLAWRIPGMGEPGGLPSMGSHRVGHNLETEQPQQRGIKNTSTSGTILKEHLLNIIRGLRHLKR